jgi:hypothetical protein
MRSLNGKGKWRKPHSFEWNPRKEVQTMAEDKHLSFEENEELKRIKQTHADLERRLGEYESRHYLTPLDDLEMKKIKKKKLACKDAIERILTRHRRMEKKENEDTQ